SPVFPLLGVAACIFLMTGLPAITWIRFILWLILGLIVYFTYSYGHSMLHPKNSIKRHANKDN
ncbi:MAG: amino acid permease C-terminal domain-containing protein, partial [Candidatus Goldiibacteriota bacterium]